MNVIHIAGNLGADAEVRYTSTGKKVTTLRVASRTRKGGNDDTIWYRVTIWGEQYDKLVPYLKKGSGIMVVGEFHKPELFNDREGKSQISLEITASYIQFSPFGRPASQGAGQPNQQNGGPTASSQGSQELRPPYGGGGGYASTGADSHKQSEGATFDDEVPF